MRRDSKLGPIQPWDVEDFLGSTSLGKRYFSSGSIHHGGVEKKCDF